MADHEEDDSVASPAVAIPTTRIPTARRVTPPPASMAARYSVADLRNFDEALNSGNVDGNLRRHLHNILVQYDQMRRSQPAPSTAAPVPATTGPALTSPPLREFKVTSVKPPTFNGDVRKKPAHEAQAIIDEYLHVAAAQARLHGFLADNEAPTYTHQPTWVAWISTGLAGLALTYWRRLDEDARDHMSWFNYRKWIKDMFTSPLTRAHAIESLDALVQKGSAVAYSQAFNELVAAIEACGIFYQPEHLCVKYMKGLKPILRQNPDLFKLDNNLAELQHEAERLDDFMWRHGNQRANPTRTTPPQPPQRQQQRQPHPFRQQRADVTRYVLADDPMELDTLRAIKGKGPASTTGTNGHSFRPSQSHSFRPSQPQPTGNGERLRKLTEDEKTYYRQRGWCTFCRAHDHTYENCAAPGKKTYAPRVNVTTIQADGSTSEHDGH